MGVHPVQDLRPAVFYEVALLQKVEGKI